MAEVAPVTTKIPALDPVHDGRHILADNPLARESIPYVLVLGAEGIVANSYTWVDRAGMAGGIFFMFGPGVGAQPIVEIFDSVAVPPERNFDNWQVGGLQFRQDLKLQHADVAVRSKRAGLTFHFEALHPAYAYGFHARGCPPYVADNRTEQTGRMTGVLDIDGRVIRFDTTGVRDHSWGTRDWQVPQHWKWLHAQAGTETAIHFFQIQALGSVELRGYVLRDGLLAEVTELETDFEVNAQYFHTTISCVIHDSADRVTRLDGTCFGHHAFLPNPHTTLNQGAMHCEIGGKPGTGYVEFQWPTSYLNHIKERMALSRSRFSE